MESTRFPGKPLIKINKIPMVEHVRRRAMLCGYFSEVYVATCNKEIFDCILTYGGKAMMTSSKHLDCTDRICEASKKIDCTHIVNVQGDSILVNIDDLEKICKDIIKNPKNDFWNLISLIKTKKDLSNRSIVKCFLNTNKKIYFLFRNISDYNYRNVNNIYRVVGLMAYSKPGLRKFSKLKPTINELNYSIEQFRIVENCYDLRTVLSQNHYPDVNKMSDLKIVRRYLKEDFVQKKIISRII